MPKIYCNDDDYRDNVSIELSRSLSLIHFKAQLCNVFLHLSNIYKRLLLYMNCVKEKNSK